MPLGINLALRLVLSRTIAKGRDLSAVLAFMPVVRVNEKIIQSIDRSIPWEGSSLTERFWGKLCRHGYDLSVRVVELSQYFFHGFLLATAHLSVIESASQFKKPVQHRSRITPSKGGQHIDQHLFIGG